MRNVKHTCVANFLVRLRLTPLKQVFFKRSYRLNDSNSNTRHKWLRKWKWRFNRTVYLSVILTGLKLIVLISFETKLLSTVKIDVSSIIFCICYYLLHCKLIRLITQACIFIYVLAVGNFLVAFNNELIFLFTSVSIKCTL